jgi:hypothetical protein
MRSITLGVAAVVSTLALSACANGSPTAGAPAPAPTSENAAAATGTSATPEATTSPDAEPTEDASGTKPAPSRTTAKPKPVTSDLSQLKSFGIDLFEGVLIDVADDGEDRYLQIGKNSVDFTGTSKIDSTMMSLKAAPVREKNRVLIQPPFWNEDLGAGHCVADTTGAPLKLEVCKTGRAAQIWEVRPAGDSGQFELHGIHGVVRVDNGKITTGGTGRTGLQTIPFAD